MERGVALVIVLVLLAILTMLVMASAGTATAELVMAGNEQYREHASDAAAAGIEQAMVRLRSTSGEPTSASITAGPVTTPGSATDSYTTTTRYIGDETSLPQSSAGKLIGYHYVIQSVGNAPRGAVDEQTQGVLIIAPTAGADMFHRIGRGLTGASGP